MDLAVTLPDGAEITFECEHEIASAWVCKAILEGQTYPLVSFAGDVRTVWDAGANVGATSVFFAHMFPDATVHSFEPTTATRAILERNVADRPRVHVHPFGLLDHDDELELYASGWSGQHSVHRPDDGGEFVERVQLRTAGAVAAELGDVPIDVLKLDVEGCEVEVLESLGPDRLAQVKVLYVEYDHRSSRRRIEQLLGDTHDLFYSSMLLLDQGEMMWLSQDLSDHPDAHALLVDIVRASWQVD
jgi:FkbM family methyltransferase